MYLKETSFCNLFYNNTDTQKNHRITQKKPQNSAMWEYFLMSDTDDSTIIQSTISTLSTPSTPSTPSSIRSKRSVNVGTRSNKSHTAYFFHIDENNSEIAYCKICESNLDGKAYPYSRKGGNTSTLIVHLREKHNITKNNFTEYLDENTKEV